MEINSNNNLMINSQVMKTTFNPSAAFNSKAKGAVYAEKGEPMYQKDMDKDEDGVITFDEFNDYCDENNISYGQRSEMLQNRLNYQLHKDRARVSAEIREVKGTKKEGDSVYAERGDKNYDEAMDADKDGKVTYQEYLKYCEEQEKEKNENETSNSQETSNAKMESKDDEVVITNPAKAVSTYAKTEKGETESKIEDEA